MTDEKHIGSCLCGSVAIETIGTPSSVAACHCQSCRKHTGAPVAVFVDYLVSQVSYANAKPTLYESSIGVRRGFCAVCGSTISYQANNLPNMIHIHIGVFDTPEAFTPSANEEMETKLPWLCVSTVRVDHNDA
jgi:hypothetical protein